ncbi:MAG: hypothetical protein OEZ13_13515 [Spirochaetia bacterium]|nr:hypothetical protein [Spirochaetia bacterium]
MQTLKKIFKVPKEHEIKIQIPDDIPENEKIEIHLIYKNAEITKKDKINKLKKAMKDKLFLKDIEEIHSDFMKIDSEGW